MLSNQFITMIHSFGLYSLGLLLGFILTPFVIRTKIIQDEVGIALDKDYDQLFLAYKFVDEVDEAPQSTLTEEELGELSNKVLHYEIPYINQKIILFYDHKKGGFSYYANSGIIYKYLNVAARRYVLDFACKQIFKEMVPSMKKEEKTVTFGNFVPKVGKTLLEKDLNQYHYLGTFQDFERKPVNHKKIDFSEYMKMLETIVADPVIVLGKESPNSPKSIQEDNPLESIPEPENKIMKVLDFLRQFSSTPKSLSTKTD